MLGILNYSVALIIVCLSRARTLINVWMILLLKLINMYHIDCGYILHLIYCQK